MHDQPVILVTGGASGLGAMLVAHFARKGWGVTMNYRQAHKADALLAELDADTAGRVLKARADVTLRDQVRAMFAATLDRFGRVDALVNAAGINRDAPFLELSDADWDAVVGAHLKGSFICCQEYLRHNGDAPGHIVNIGASCGFRGRTNGANFCSAKGGILALTKCLAREFAPRIQVNCLIPGSFDTPDVRERYRIDTDAGRARVVSGIPMQRIGAPDDWTHMVDSLLASRFTTGANIFVNGGDFMQ